MATLTSYFFFDAPRNFNIKPAFNAGPLWLGCHCLNVVLPTTSTTRESEKHTSLASRVCDAGLPAWMCHSPEWSDIRGIFESRGSPDYQITASASIPQRPL